MDWNESLGERKDLLSALEQQQQNQAPGSGCYFIQSSADGCQKSRLSSRASRGLPRGLGLTQRSRRGENWGIRFVLLLLSGKQRGEVRDFLMDRLFRKALSNLLYLLSQERWQSCQADAPGHWWKRIKLQSLGCFTAHSSRLPWQCLGPYSGRHPVVCCLWSDISQSKVKFSGRMVITKSSESPWKRLSAFANSSQIVESFKVFYFRFSRLEGTLLKLR